MGVKYFRKLSTIIPTLLFLLALSSQALGDDTTPAVISASPTGASVPLNSIITITWSEDIDCSTVNTDNITISGGSGLLSSNCSGSQATFTTYGQTFSTNYTVTVAAGVTDLAGNPMTSPYSWNFTTQPDIFDTSFNSTGTIPGIVTYSGAAGGNNDYGYSITTDSSGNILVTGESDESEDNSEMVIWRYKPDGTLDTSFNSSGTKPGIVTYSGATGGNYDYGYSITTDSSHNILVTGASTNASGNQHMAIWRYNTNGMPDTSFNSSGTTPGIVVSPGAGGGNYEYGNSITTDSSHNILVTGASTNASGYYGMVIWRYNTDGTLDTSFNSSGTTPGIVVSPGAGGGNYEYGNSITTDSSHNILVTGASTNASGNQHMAIWRYNTNGMPDTSFNGTGIVVSPGAAEGNSDTGNSITTDSSGKILVTGYSWNESDPEMVIWRYNPDGTLDTTFNGTGIVVSDNMTGANGDQGNSIALDTSGRVLVTGESVESEDNSEMVIWRYKPDGTLDATFNSTGTTPGILPYSGAAGGYSDYGASITTDSSGRILVTGASRTASGNWEMAVWRYTETVPETTPPTVISTNPTNGATGVAVDAILTVTFSEAMDSLTINPTNIMVVKQSDPLTSIPVNVSYDVEMNSALIQGSPNLEYNTTYIVRIIGPGGVKDLAGNYMASYYIWSFTTVCPTITVSPATLPNGTQGTAYSQTITASGGTSPYGYGIVTGSLPAGVTLSSAGVLSGTPTTSGTFNFTVTATDTNSCIGSQAYALTITALDTIPNPFTFTDQTNVAKSTVITSNVITVSGINAPSPVTIVGGQYSINEGGYTSAAGAVNNGDTITVQVTSSPNYSTTANATLTIGGVSDIFSVTTLALTCPTIMFSPASLPNGTKGTAYNQTITSSGGAAPYTYTTDSSALPTGLSLSSGGAVTGTPTATGTFTFTVTATDSNKCTASQTYSVVTNPPVCPTVALSALTGGTKGTAYSQTITATPTGSYAYALTTGSLPAGLTLSSAGVLSGTPTTSGTFNFTVTATDANGCTGSGVYNVTVAGTPKISVSPASLVDFNLVALGNSEVKKLTVTNTGDGDLIISSIAVKKSGDFTQTATCATLAPESSCEIEVTYSPESVGKRKAVLTITSNDPDTHILLVYLAGQGTAISDTLYITDSSDNAVSCIEDGILTEDIATGHTPLGVAVSPSGDTVYVTNYNSNTLSILSTATNGVLSTAGVGTNPVGVAVGPKGDVVYVANFGSDSVSVLNPTTGEVISTIPVDYGPSGVVVSPDGSIVYVTNYWSGTVSMIDTLTGVATATVSVGSGPYGVTVHPSGEVVYTADYGSDAVSFVETSTRTIIGTVPVGINPTGLALDPSGNFLYVTNFGSNTVSVIDTATKEVVKTVDVGLRPFGISVNPGGNLVYVTNWGDNSVSVINTTTGNVLETVSVGNSPIAFGNFVLPEGYGP